MLKAFLEFRQRREQEEDSLFCRGFSMPGKQALQAGPPSGEYVAWEEVQNFLKMAEEALKVRTQATEELSKELECARSEQQKVERTRSAAVEESSFLTEHMQSLLDERQHLKEALEKAQREKEHLARENELLRQELLEGAALGEESSAALQLLARQQEELREVQQRNAQLENENVQLQARVSALERANTAQQCAMLSCLEESERVRLQVAQQQQQHADACNSPIGPLALQHSGYISVITDDSALADPLDAGSESGSFLSCITPYGSIGGSPRIGSSSGGGGGSVFHSVEPTPEPSPRPKQQQPGGAGWRQSSDKPCPVEAAVAAKQAQEGQQEGKAQ